MAARDRGALVGVQGEVDVPDQELALPGLGQGFVHDPEIHCVGDTSQ